MKVLFNFQEDLNCIIIKAEGDFPIDEEPIHDIYDEMEELSKTYNTSKFIIDLTKMKYEVPITSIIDSTQRVTQYNFTKRKLTVAYVCSEISDSTEKLDMFFSHLDSAIFLNKIDINYDRFISLNEAKKWIKKK
ncbi:MAG: hypothetical protein K9N09_03235 [Candidatus Cloacimonetes bacterium]|nr:hypothetical protein [Candidatus Cloacimonadota bacterium]MCF7814518.1 hypothetical protein [Candidatus Cloacimonadota bacterium]MCF7867690.1 hypothetical protein [Candidatus Cloacimonadota bacterium]MCF7883512.1 hypothetical protein [Candidatus Cloacimonadota bacterium]